jgi:uncharacterized C2H2 Zn-finger protein
MAHKCPKCGELIRNWVELQAHLQIDHRWGYTKARDTVKQMKGRK